MRKDDLNREADLLNELLLEAPAKYKEYLEKAEKNDFIRNRTINFLDYCKLLVQINHIEKTESVADSLNSIDAGIRDLER